ncbi:MAG: cache domain-containing protein, partial [Alphaproteobacteria bacterium]
MRLTFKRFVVAGIIGLQVVTVTAVLLSSQLSTQDVILGYARQIMGGLADDTAERSRRFMAPAQAAVELTARLAESGVVGFDDIDALERYLFEQLRMRPQIAGLYYGRTDGEFLYVKRDAERDPDGVRTKYISHRSGERMVHLWWRDPDFVRAGDAADPADTFDPRERPWYRAAVARGGPVWTDPYIFFTSRQPGVTAASPIYTKAGSLAGVIGVDVEIGAIGEFLNGLALGRNGSAFILSADGEVLAVPGVSMPPRPEGTGDKLRFTRVEELEDPVAKAAAATLWALPPGRSGQAV